jgi:hypothetical protein
VFAIVNVPDQAADLTEQVGTRPKFWFKTGEATACLFKEVRQVTGEDWSEKVACGLADLLGLPHAEYDFAAWRGKRGVVTPTFVPERGRLVLGNELLASFAPDYPGTKSFRAKEHVLRTVLTYLRTPELQLPLGWQGFAGVEAAIDVFVGYLMLDAWLGNQDRHHENWGVVVSAASTIHLAPTYDHASSLGRNETDANRSIRLATTDRGRSIERYVERARSALYPSRGAPPLLTLDAFIEAGRARPSAAKGWLGRLRDITLGQTRTIFGNIPPQLITPPAVAFAVKMLELNQARLLEAGKTL